MTSVVGKKLLEVVGDRNFTYSDEDGVPALAQNNAKRIELVLIRKTIGPFVNRSDMPDETISIQMPDNREVIQVPARKFKSKEKLLGFRILRLLGKLDRKYRYNEVSSIEQLRNPNSVLMGDTMVEGGDAGTFMLPARALYSDSYSLEDRKHATYRLQHNALSEERTTWDRTRSGIRQSLFESEYVFPGVYFPSFITLLDPTPEMLYHLLLVLHENTYGAQTAVTGPNFENRLIGIVNCKFEPPVTSYTISAETSDSKGDEAALTEKILDTLLKKKAPSDEILSGERLTSLINTIETVNQEEMKEAYEVLKSDTDTFFDFVRGETKKKGQK